jgi:AcrR family transcriptional regulator
MIDHYSTRLSGCKGKGTSETGEDNLYHIKNDKRAVLTARMITDAVSALIMEGEWGKFSVTLLAERAKVGRASFYRSFDTVEDVLQFLTDQAMRDLFEFIQGEIKQMPEFSETDIYIRFYRYWNRHDQLPILLLKSGQQAIFKTRLMRLYQENLSFVRHKLHIQESHWNYFVILRCSVLSDGLFEWMKNGKIESPEEISRILLLSFSELHDVKFSLKS